MNMDVEQLKEVYNSGLVTIGAHTMRHPILKNESDESSYKEISESVTQLSEVLGEKIEYFAYPNGDPVLDFSDREMSTLKALGIKLAFSTENKRIERNDLKLSVPRNGISYGSDRMILTKLYAGSSWGKIKRMISGKSESDYRKEILAKINRSRADH
jgi:hypothetical protein